MQRFGQADAAIFLADFGLPWFRGTVAPANPALTFLGNFDTADDSVAVGRGSTVSRNFELTVSSADIATSGLQDTNDFITVNGAVYRVREILALDDGVFSRIAMSKI